jgi:peptidoglycan-associated lipoprotein
MMTRQFTLTLSVATTLMLSACAGAPPVDGSAVRPGSIQDFAVNAGDRVFFETDSTDLTPAALATLDRQAQWLGRYSAYSFVVEGHADERGTREYNFSLSGRRAQTVRDYLISRGVAGSRFRTVAYGKERPVAICNDISCWSQNRRGVTALADRPRS